MQPKSSIRSGLSWIALGSLIFCIGLVAFCYSLGLDFSSEGWSDTSPSLKNLVQSPSFIVSILAMTVSIIVFFVGVQKVSK